MYRRAKSKSLIDTRQSKMSFKKSIKARAKRFSKKLKVYSHKRN